VSKSSGDGPLARSTDLIVEELGDEVLVYDTKTNRGHSLSSQAATIWRACDGETSADALSVKLGLEVGKVERGLDELRACELLETPAATDGRSTRREATFRLARLGAAAASAPLILSVAAQPAWAVPTLAACLERSGNCGAGQDQTGCKVIGCCCCRPEGSLKRCVDVFANCPPGGGDAPSGYNTCA
jgi:hypothetical protein